MIKNSFLLLAVFAFLLAPNSRSAEPTTVAGKWHFVLETPGGDRESDAVLELNADKVTGKWAVDDKNGGDSVAGTFAEKTLTLEFTHNSEEIGPGKMTIKGKLADDGTMSGEWTFQDYSGTFKATRVKEAAK